MSAAVAGRWWQSAVTNLDKNGRMAVVPEPLRPADHDEPAKFACRGYLTLDSRGHYDICDVC